MSLACADGRIGSPARARRSRTNLGQELALDFFLVPMQISRDLIGQTSGGLGL